MEQLHSPELEKADPSLGRIAAPDAAPPSPASGKATAPATAPLPLDRLRDLLLPALHSKHGLDWASLKRHEEYPEPEPAYPEYAEYPPEPNPESACYKPSTHAANGALDPAVEQRRREGYERYVRDYTAWAEQVKKIEADNERRYEAGVAAVREWHRRLHQHRQAQDEHNDRVERRQTDYQALLASAVEDYCRHILTASPLPEPLPRVFELQYLPANRTLLINHALPLPQHIPRVKGVKFVKSRGQHVEVLLSDAQLGPVYADVVYQICLRTLHELFDADLAQGLDAVIFNGWVELPDASAMAQRKCVLSVRADKRQLTALNLSEMDAKACFKALKGVAGAKLHRLEPVTPLSERSEKSEVRSEK